MTMVKFVCRLALPLLLITAVMAAALGGIDAITADRIANAKEAKVQEAIKTVLSDGWNVQLVSFSAQDHPLVKAVYAAASGYAVEVEPAGFGGGISMMVGVSGEGKVLGVQIISHTETAGLGAVAAATTSAGQSFRDSFTGLTYPATVSKDGGEADTITGATITSRAVADGVNAALACVKNLNQEAQS